jgi:hypothetical protein
VKCFVVRWSGGSNLVATCDVVMRCDAAMRDGVCTVAREEGQDSTVAQSMEIVSRGCNCTSLSARHHRGFCLIRRVRQSSCTQQATQLLQEASEPITLGCDERDKSHDCRWMR